MAEIWKDPIVEEIHRTREKLASEHGDDLHAIVLHLKKLEAESRHEVVAPRPRPASVRPQPTSMPRDTP